MLRNAIIRWFVNAVALGAAEFMFPGIIFHRIRDLLIAAALFGILNTIIKPILIVFTLPINILSLGLFTFIINAFMLALTAAFLSGFEVSGFWSAVGGAIIVSLVSIILNLILRQSEDR
jgi:putative membrane protein